MSLRPLALSVAALLLAACATSAKKPVAPPPSAAAPAEAAAPQRRPLPEVSPRQGGAKLLSLRDILKLLEASPVQYEVQQLDALKGADRPEDLRAATWPARREPFYTPTVVTGPDGVRAVDAYPARPELDQMLEAAEPAYQAKRYAEAERAYAEVLARAPDYYPALLAYGDAAVFDGRPREALERYASAHQANPHDLKAHFYRATALRHLGRLDEAREELAWALTLRPSYPTIVEMLQGAPGRVGLRLEPPRLLPRALVRREGEKVAVYLDPKASMAWLGWGMCKAMWRGEPAHRKAMLGHEEDVGSNVEELECLAALLTAYEQHRAKGEQDAALERVREVVEAGFASQLLQYEVLARMEPHATLALDEASRARLHSYVMRFVLPAVEP